MYSSCILSYYDFAPFLHTIKYLIIFEQKKHVVPPRGIHKLMNLNF